MPLFVYCSCDHRDLHPFPTRRSSDSLRATVGYGATATVTYTVTGSGEPFAAQLVRIGTAGPRGAFTYADAVTDEERKSTRLNSSHLGISYAVVSFKKKINKRKQRRLI